METELLHNIFDKLVSMDQEFKEVRTTVNRMEIKLDSVEKRLDSVEIKLDSVEKRLDSVENRLDSMENKLDSVDKRLSSVEKKLDTTHEQVVLNSEAITDIAKLKSTIITHDHHFNIIDRQITTHAIDIDKLKSR